MKSLACQTKLINRHAARKVLTTSFFISYNIFIKYSWNKKFLWFVANLPTALSCLHCVVGSWSQHVVCNDLCWHVVTFVVCVLVGFVGPLNKNLICDGLTWDYVHVVELCIAIVTASDSWFHPLLTCVCTHTHTLTLTHTLSLSLTRTHTHSDTHSHIHTFSPPSWLSWFSFWWFLCLCVVLMYVSCLLHDNTASRIDVCIFTVCISFKWKTTLFCY